MTCSHCEHAVRTEILALDSVADVAVNATSGEVSIVHDAPLGADAVSAAIERLGYEIRSWSAARDV
jgi:copper chaperone CopZ